MGVTALLASAGCTGPSTGPTGDFEVAEASILELQAALEDGRATSAGLVDRYLARIAAYDRLGPALNTIIRLNPLARRQAEALDEERAAGTVRGPLHGIPDPDEGQLRHGLDAHDGVQSGAGGTPSG